MNDVERTPITQCLLRGLDVTFKIIWRTSVNITWHTRVPPPVLRKPVAMPALSAMQFRNAESPAVGSLHRPFEIVRFGPPPDRTRTAGSNTLHYAVYVD